MRGKKWGTRASSFTGHLFASLLRFPPVASAVPNDLCTSSRAEAHDYFPKPGNELAEAWVPRNPAPGWESEVPLVQGPRRPVFLKNERFCAIFALKWVLDGW